MQIPKQFQQFKNNPTLLAVFGNQSGIFYLAENGLIEEVNKIEVITPKYSDNEGFSEIRSKTAGIISSGSSREIPKEKIHKEFIKKAASYILEVDKKGAINEIYLFCAPEIINQFKNELPKQLRDKIKKEIRGMYLKDSPTQLLNLI
ncbi:MAG: hypothetical protein COV29_00310 [Candidatus Yanofskybacteria bacterium CG10_big_fil_rev_8_21_14_0_10_36_16]|uniref:Host attachment protein n=1 Tax=Candidatus Yanofskybacteria bacterium CG10_big_fil_rev_8_21_14_0_10_36_16 TaxID=1975096 RepID=A0A2J0Q8Y1_9BACT|nr:MAG: hypothetical protein COV29_00310 [Candidatus Yanofskybacteria bacterium CG10_big_fil_rev_8_21_14_0_10_36_16]